MNRNLFSKYTQLKVWRCYYKACFTLGGNLVI